MFNVGGGELLVILLVALIVLGPTRLPTVAKQAGNMMSQLRNMSAQFSKELQDAVPDEVTELRDELDKTRAQLKGMTLDDEIERRAREKGKRLVEEEKEELEAKKKPMFDPFGGKQSTAAAAGMYNASKEDADDEDESEASDGEPETDDESQEVGDSDQRSDDEAEPAETTEKATEAGPVGDPSE